MTTTIRTTTPIREGISASIPPDWESFWCFAVIFDFFFFFTMRLLLDEGDGENSFDLASSIDQSLCLSVLFRLLRVVGICLDDSIGCDPLQVSADASFSPFILDESIFSPSLELLDALRHMIDK
jgi:hypothetical protein